MDFVVEFLILLSNNVLFETSIMGRQYPVSFWCTSQGFDILKPDKNDPHGKYSYHTSPLKVITILWTVFPMLCTLHSHALFSNCKFVPLNPIQGRIS